MIVTRRALFITAADKPWGAEHSLRTLLASAPKEWSCSLLASSRDVAELCRQYLEDIVLLPAQNSKIRTLWVFLRATTKIANQYDIIVLFSLKLLPLALLMRIRYPRIHIIADLHDTPVGVDRVLSRFFLHFTNATIAISQYVKEHVGIRNATIVPRPISESDRYDSGRQSSKRSGQIILGIIGRIDREKRIEVAIAAVRSLPEEFSLHIYGEPCVAGDDYLRMLKREASQSARIHFRGYMCTDEIYTEIDAVIVCNEKEASGRTIGEAMLRSKLVFAPDRGGAREFFDDTTSGFVYRSLDSQDLAHVVASTFALGRDTELITHRARERILAERSPQPVAKRYFLALERAAR